MSVVVLSLLLVWVAQAVTVNDTFRLHPMVLVRDDPLTPGWIDDEVVVNAGDDHTVHYDVGWIGAGYSNWLYITNFSVPVVGDDALYNISADALNDSTLVLHSMRVELTGTLHEQVNSNTGEAMTRSVLRTSDVRVSLPLDATSTVLSTEDDLWWPRNSSNAHVQHYHTADNKFGGLNGTQVLAELRALSLRIELRVFSPEPRSESHLDFGSLCCVRLVLDVSYDKVPNHGVGDLSNLPMTVNLTSSPSMVPTVSPTTSSITQNDSDDDDDEGTKKANSVGDATGNVIDALEEGNPAAVATTGVLSLVLVLCYVACAVCVARTQKRRKRRKQHSKARHRRGRLPHSGALSPRSNTRGQYDIRVLTKSAPSSSYDTAPLPRAMLQQHSPYGMLTLMQEASAPPLCIETMEIEMAEHAATQYDTVPNNNTTHASLYTNKS